MITLFVAVKDTSQLTDLAQYGTIEWVSKLTNTVILYTEPRVIASIQRLPNVVHVEISKMGSL
jgi:uncharacterized protein YlbG (UPF0298 family)